MVDWPVLLGGIFSFVPALGVLFLSYGPYDGHFKDNILFLFLIGGVVAGMATAFFEFLLLLPRGDALYTPAMVLVGFPVLEAGLKLVVLNRKQYQGQRETLFYGGAFGLGFATMAVLFMSQRTISLAPYANIGNLFSGPGRAVELLAVGLAVLLAHFATGIVVGEGVRSRKLTGAFTSAAVMLVPLQFLVFEFTAGLAAGAEGEGTIYLPLMLLYAGGLAWWAHAKLLPRALPPDAQRKRRRELLLRKRAEAGKE